MTPLTSLVVVKPNETRAVDTQDASQSTGGSGTISYPAGSPVPIGSGRNYILFISIIPSHSNINSLKLRLSWILRLLKLCAPSMINMSVIARSNIYQHIPYSLPLAFILSFLSIRRKI